MSSAAALTLKNDAIDEKVTYFAIFANGHSLFVLF